MMGRIEGNSGSARRMDGRNSRDTMSAGDALPSWGRQCSARSSHSEADSERPRQINGEGGGAAAPVQWPGGPARGSGSGSARRMGSDDSRGTRADGDTPRNGASRAWWRPPAAERSSSGGTTARAAGQRHRRSGPAGPARGNGSSSARRVGGGDSGGTWADGDTPPLGPRLRAGGDRRRPPAVGEATAVVEQRGRRGGGGRSTAARRAATPCRAERGRPSPGGGGGAHVPP